MDLKHWGQEYQRDVEDLKKRPSVYFLKVSAYIVLLSCLYLIISPAFSGIENTLTKLGSLGVALTGLLSIIRLVVSKIHPIIVLLDGTLIGKLDVQKDLIKLNAFYVMLFAGSYMIKSLASVFVIEIKVLYEQYRNFSK